MSGAEARPAAILQRKAKRAARRDGQHRVLHHVNSGDRQLGATSVRAFQDRELAAGRALGHLGRAHKTILDSGQNHFCAGPFGDALAIGIVRIQDHRPVGADGFRQSAFFRGDRFAAAHEFDKAPCRRS